MVGDNLPQGWKWTTVEEIKKPNSKAIVSGPFGSNIGSRFFVESGIPVIRGNNLTTDMRRFVDDGFVFITDEKAQELKNCEAVPNDLIFTAAGTLGQVGIIPSEPKYSRYIISNKQMRARLDENLVLPLFAFYWLSSGEMVEYIQQRNTGSTVPLINLTVLRQLPLPLPPLHEQQSIARILGALDDKIELNRHLNYTLEEMARALFKSWFVDFDPVTAKAEGRTPFGMNAEIASLFPAEFEKTGEGALPKGWKIGSLGKMFPKSKEVVLTGPFGSNLHAHDYRDEGVPLILVKHVNDGYISQEGLPLVGQHKAFELERYRLKTGDIVFTRVGAVGRSAYVHSHNEGWMISGQMLRVRLPNSTQVDPRYLAQVFLEPDFIDMVEGHALGTTRPSLNTEILLSFKFLIPTPQIQQAYTNIISKFDSQIQSNLRQIKTLTSIRDVLLPRLMSGELRMKQAEKMIENM